VYVDASLRLLQPEPLQYVDVWLAGTRLGYVNVSYDAAGESDLPLLLPHAQKLLEVPPRSHTRTPGGAPPPPTTPRLPLRPERAIRYDCERRVASASACMLHRSVLSNFCALTYDSPAVPQLRAGGLACYRARRTGAVPGASVATLMRIAALAYSHVVAQAACAERAAAAEHERRAALAGRQLWGEAS
jgi:hypothetical protein